MCLEQFCTVYTGHCFLCSFFSRYLSTTPSSSYWPLDTINRTIFDDSSKICWQFSVSPVNIGYICYINWMRFQKNRISHILETCCFSSHNFTVLTQIVTKLFHTTLIDLVQLSFKVACMQQLIISLLEHTTNRLQPQILFTISKTIGVKSDVN